MYTNLFSKFMRIGIERDNQRGNLMSCWFRTCLTINLSKDRVAGMFLVNYSNIDSMQNNSFRNDCRC